MFKESRDRYQGPDSQDADPRDLDHQRLRARVAEAIFNFACRRNHMEISENSIFHLHKFNEVLKKGSAVVYINHVGMADFTVASPMVIMLPATRRFLGPIAMKHYDFRRDPATAAAFRLFRLAGIYASPVVQPNDTASYTVEAQMRMSRNLHTETARLLQMPGTVYGIPPEGTRSKDGILKRAQRGIGHLESVVGKGMKLTYMPVGLVYAPHMSDTPEICVGSPFTLNELFPSRTVFSKRPKERDQQVTDVLMLKLAEMLPQGSRGAYANPGEFLTPLGLSPSDIGLAA
jgi:hypothetical protein